MMNIVTKVLLNLVPILLSNFDQDGGDFGDDHGHNAGQKPLENPVKSQHNFGDDHGQKVQNNVGKNQW